MYRETPGRGHLGGLVGMPDKIEHLMGCWRKLLLRSSAIYILFYFTLFYFAIGKEMVPLRK